MHKFLVGSVITIATSVLVLAAQGTVIKGTVKKVDAAAKTVAIATADGTEEVVHFTDKTVVHGTVVGAKDTFHGLVVGSEVVAHVTASGATKTATEVDHLGKGGLKVMKGTVTKVDEGGKKVSVATADGSVTVFDVTKEGTVDIGKGTAKGTKVTVHYIEEGGKKIAHFFE